MNKIGSVNGKNILLLQGPMGNFFKKLDNHLRKNGAKTFRIGFNVGDAFFSNRDNYTPFKDDRKAWPAFVEKFMITNEIDLVFLFGDCRYYQSVAIKKAKKIRHIRSIKVFVFEEGYVRPDYITMEAWGVNAYSSLSRKREFYEALPLKDTPKPQPAKTSKTQIVFSAIIYYFLSKSFLFLYPHYKHHRDMSAIKEAFYGIRGLFRKIAFPLLYESGIKDRIKTNLNKKYFFVPLQTHTDFQILVHSKFISIEKFIINVLESFSKNALKEDYLIFKHHPVDRGRKNYREFIFEQAEIFGLSDRVIVLYDTHLPTLIKHSKGCVTINSTVGLSAIYHNIPTKTLGKAIYNINGLTAKEQSLREFWKNPQGPNSELFKKFYAYIIENTQLNGSFYGLFPKDLKEASFRGTF